VVKFDGQCHGVGSGQVFKSIEVLGKRFYYTDNPPFLAYLIV
jgi:hypothetical protein